MIQGDLHDATLLSEGAHLVVSEVARMVAQGATTAMTAYDGCLAELQRIVETLLAGMAEVHHDA